MMVMITPRRMSTEWQEARVTHEQVPAAASNPALEH